MKRNFTLPAKWIIISAWMIMLCRVETFAQESAGSGKLQVFNPDKYKYDVLIRTFSNKPITVTTTAGEVYRKTTFHVSGPSTLLLDGDTVLLENITSVSGQIVGAFPPLRRKYKMTNGWILATD